jgi:predicted transport protein
LVEFQTQRLLLFLKLNPNETSNLPGIARDVTGIGHYGTGDLEITLRSLEDLEVAKPFIEMAYRKVGG